MPTETPTFDKLSPLMQKTIRWLEKDDQCPTPPEYGEKGCPVPPDADLAFEEFPECHECWAKAFADEREAASHAC